MKKPGTSVSTRRHQSGQALVEFALVATCFLLLIFSVMLMAQAVYTYNNVCAAAREAVRYAIVHRPITNVNTFTDADIKQVAVNYAPFLSLSDVTVTWPADSKLTSQYDAKVVVSHNYSLNIPFMPAASLTLSSTSQMLVSQ